MNDTALFAKHTARAPPPQRHVVGACASQRATAAARARLCKLPSPLLAFALLAKATPPTHTPLCLCFLD